MQYKHYRVGDAFPAEAKSAAFVRLLVASRQLTAFLHFYQQLDPSKSPGERERFYFVVSASFGASKETADALRDADSYGVFQWIDSGKGSDDLKATLERVREGCSKKNTSLYSGLIKRIRDSAAWHWSRGEVQEALEAVADEHLPTVEGENESSHVAIPLVVHLLAATVLLQRIPMEELRDVMIEVLEFYGDLIDVVHRTYEKLVTTGRA